MQASQTHDIPRNICIFDNNGQGAEGVAQSSKHQTLGLIPNLNNRQECHLSS